MKLNRIRAVAVAACAIIGASIPLASAAQAAPFSAATSSSAAAAHRPAVADAAPTCAYSSANLHFYYWGPPSDKSLVWSSTSSSSGNAVLLGNKKTSSPLDCFKSLGFGHSQFSFQQNNSDLCLNVAGNSKSSGAWIILYPCVSTANEKFTLDTYNNETQLQSVSSGLCVDLGNGYNALSHLEQKACQGRSDKYQEWTYATS
jgi:ricin-type beta-trefoil lectin protein